MSNPFEFKSSVRNDSGSSEEDQVPKVRKRNIPSVTKEITEETLRKIDEVAVRQGVATNDEVLAHTRSKANQEKSVTVTFRIPVRFKNMIDAEAEKNEWKKVVVIRKALEAYCREQGLPLP